MHLKLIACKILQREIASLVYNCPNSVDVTMMKQSYHSNPSVLKQALQEEIDKIDENNDPYTDDLDRRDIDAILLGYGLCANAVEGIKSRKYRIVIPRAHDCATLVMGSKEAYQDYFETWKGSFFYTRGWLEMNALTDSSEQLERKRKEYMDKYEDEETVEYLLEMEKEMIKNYRYFTYVEWPELADDLVEEKIKEIAAQKGLTYNYMRGSNSLLVDLVNGNWDPERFLVLKPGKEITPSYDKNIIKAKEIVEV